MLETKSLEEARISKNLLEEEPKDYHIEGVDDGVFDQMTLFPMSKLMAEYSQDLPWALFPLLKKEQVDTDVVIVGLGVAMHVHIVALFDVDLSTCVTNLLAQLFDLFFDGPLSLIHELFLPKKWHYDLWVDPLDHEFNHGSQGSEPQEHILLIKVDYGVDN